MLTGATGSIGAHILFELLHDDSVSKVFCMTRREFPLESILQSLIAKELYITPEQASKIVALRSALDQPNLGLEADSDVLHQLQQSVTQVIHVAWPVNFNLPLNQFEPHIRGLHNLIQFSLSVSRSEPAVLMFCSSVSTALKAPSAKIPEAPMGLECAYLGYGQSKLVCEHIISIARHSGARAYSLRIGQVSGHSKKGLWNDAEALPLLIRSALTLKALPDLSQSCSWLPVDKLAAVILEVTRARSAANQEHAKNYSDIFAGPGQMDDSVYNLCNPREFSWSAFLESLSRNGFPFETVPFDEWLQMLRDSEARGEGHVNPAVKLIDHYEAMYGKQSSLAQLGPKSFITEMAERDSITLRNDRLRIIEDGILSCYVRDWLNRWMTV